MDDPRDVKAMVEGKPGVASFAVDKVTKCYLPLFLLTGIKFIMDLYENSTTYKAINARLIPKALPGCEHVPFKSDAYYECFIRSFTMTIYHPVGTAKMGTGLDDPTAVVGPELE